MMQMERMILDIPIQSLQQQRLRACKSKLVTYVAVAVINPVDQLLEEVARLGFRESSGIDDSLEQLAAGGVLHHNGQVRWRQKHLSDSHHSDCLTATMGLELPN